jgi:hypothetical protein
MNPEFLGDSYDFYKRWFLDEFFPYMQLDAVPMLTGKGFTRKDKMLYQSLVGVRVIQDALVPRKTDRPGYFRVACQSEYASIDIFFDPDTGLRLGGDPPSGRPRNKYLFDSELASVLPDGSNRVAVVYDQSLTNGKLVESARQKLQSLRRNYNLAAFAYCAHVAMVVVSRNVKRVKALHRHAQKLNHLRRDRVLLVV